MPVTDPGLDAAVRPGGVFTHPHVSLDALPPPGDARRDELKKRLYELTAEAERLSAELEAEGIDPAKIEPDREVRQLLTYDGETHISNAQPDYKYSWVYRDPFNKFGGRFVHLMLAEGWERVVGDMPEARDRKSVTGERWAADCLLLRMRVDKYHLLEKQRLIRRIAREEGVAASLLEAADRHGANVHIGELPASVAQRAASASSDHMASLHPRRTQQMHAVELAKKKLDAHIRAGTVPGLPAARR